MDCRACEISHCTPFSGGRVGVYLSAKAEWQGDARHDDMDEEHSHQRK